MSETLNDAGGKERVSLSLDPLVIPIGKALAAADRRSFSNLVEVLILNERERRSVGREGAQAQEVAA